MITSIALIGLVALNVGFLLRQFNKSTKQVTEEATKVQQRLVEEVLRKQFPRAVIGIGIDPDDNGCYIWLLGDLGEVSEIAGVHTVSARAETPVDAFKNLQARVRAIIEETHADK